MPTAGAAIAACRSQAIVDYIDRTRACSPAKPAARPRTTATRASRTRTSRRTTTSTRVDELKLSRGVDDRFWTLFGRRSPSTAAARSTSTPSNNRAHRRDPVPVREGPEDPVILDGAKLFMRSRASSRQAVRLHVRELEDFADFVKDPEAQLGAGSPSAARRGRGSRRDRRCRRSPASRRASISASSSTRRWSARCCAPARAHLSRRGLGRDRPQAQRSWCAARSRHGVWDTSNVNATCEQRRQRPTAPGSTSREDEPWPTVSSPSISGAWSVKVAIASRALRQRRCSTSSSGWCRPGDEPLGARAAAVLAQIVGAPARSRQRLPRRVRRPGVHPRARVRVQEPAPRRPREGGRRRARGRRPGRPRGHGLHVRAAAIAHDEPIEAEPAATRRGRVAPPDDGHARAHLRDAPRARRAADSSSPRAPARRRAACSPSGGAGGAARRARAVARRRARPRGRSR